MQLEHYWLKIMCIENGALQMVILEDVSTGLPLCSPILIERLRDKGML